MENITRRPTQASIPRQKLTPFKVGAFRYSLALTIALIGAACSPDQTASDSAITQSNGSESTSTGNESTTTQSTTQAMPTENTGSNDSNGEEETSTLSTNTGSGTTDTSTQDTGMMDTGTTNQSTTGFDATTAAADDSAKEPECGDGVVDEGEMCDDGNSNNQDSCLETCEEASCGDGFIQEGEEECDNGAQNANDKACKADCTDNVCGDGFVGPGEQCEQELSKHCTPICEPAKMVFLTSTPSNSGNLGGITEANATCQAAAPGLGLNPNAVYLAWLATGNQNPANDFTHSTTPYINMDGEIIANNWTDLTTPNQQGEFLLNDIQGLMPTSCGNNYILPWTNVNPDGTTYSNADCGGWTKGYNDAQNGISPGLFGIAEYINSQWTVGPKYSCEPGGNPCPGFYCFEQ